MRIDIQAFLIIPTLAKSFISKQHLAARTPIWITLGCWADSTFVSVDPVIAHAATLDQIAASLSMRQHALFTVLRPSILTRKRFLLSWDRRQTSSLGGKGSNIPMRGHKCTWLQTNYVLYISYLVSHFVPINCNAKTRMREEVQEAEEEEKEGTYALALSFPF